jgi:hypothetical protein
MTQVLNVALVIFTGIVVGAVSSWITAQLSLRKFRTERWWERKAEMYSRIIEALHNSKAFADTHLKAELKGRELAEKDKELLRQRSEAAHEEISKAMDIGAFLLSNKAQTRLKQYQKETEQAGQQQSWFEYLDADWAATDKCLNDMIEIAKNDLRTE